jgi:DNA mismatch endonuclease, patch repair protein
MRIIHSAKFEPQELVGAAECYTSRTAMNEPLKTTPERSRLMSRVRQSGTSPELSVRKLLHSYGCRFRVKARDLPGSPDIVNRSARWAIFVHGCFWHAHENCRRWTIPKNNQEFWTKKFLDNRERDERKIKELKRLGYSVMTFWQCDLDNEAKAKRKILKFIEKVRNNSVEKERHIHGKSSQ